MRDPKKKSFNQPYTNYGPLANASPMQLGAFKDGMYRKQISDYERYRGRKMDEHEALQYRNRLDQKSKSFNKIGNLRFKLSQITDPTDSRRMSLQDQMRSEVNRYNQASKQTWNPGYGRGMGLMQGDGTYGGVSFNKF